MFTWLVQEKYTVCPSVVS